MGSTILRTRIRRRTPYPPVVVGVRPYLYAFVQVNGRTPNGTAQWPSCLRWRSGEQGGWEVVVGNEFVDEVADSGVDVGDDAAHGGVVLAFGVVEGPVAVVGAGDVGAVLAAALGDGQVAGGDHVGGQEGGVFVGIGRAHV